jgi:tRNA(Arg) A34 adenosine deaminase TadA
VETGTPDIDHEAAVRRKVDDLRRGDLRALEAAVVAKRLSWCDAHLAPRPRGGGEGGAAASPRRGYELLLLDYLGLDADEVPVVAESEQAITWLSRNRCPTLEACQRLGRSTARVCRAVYEKPAQALLSRLHPALRFSRDYGELRPEHPHCRESIWRLDLEGMMERAVEQAERSLATGDKGYGAVVVLEGRVVGAAHDTAASQGDPSLHAEVNAIRQAVGARGDPDLCGAVLLSTCEPCPMCAALAVWANITTIAFGASIEQTARLGKARIRLGVEELVARAPGWTEVIGGVLGPRCLELYR